MFSSPTARVLTAQIPLMHLFELCLFSRICLGYIYVTRLSYNPSILVVCAALGSGSPQADIMESFKTVFGRSNCYLLSQRVISYRL